MVCKTDLLRYLGREETSLDVNISIRDKKMDNIIATKRKSKGGASCSIVSVVRSSAKDEAVI